AITEISARKEENPVLLFDRIKGYPPGYRVVTNLYSTERRQALALGLPLEERRLGLVKAWRAKARQLKPVEPKEVSDGPVLENRMKGDAVNVLRIPAPLWHEDDGGRYIGTGCVVVTKDPDQGWVNLGVYRVQVHGKDRVGFFPAPGHHAHIMAQKYWQKGRNCPVAVICGQDPYVYAAACTALQWGESEYMYAGAIKGEPVEVLIDDLYGLPIPKSAEIVLLGEVPPPSEETAPEGPFGEFTGYYTDCSPKPVMKVMTILHRNDPILQGNPPLKPPAIGHSLGSHITTSAEIWNALDKEIPGVVGVWSMPEASASRAVITVVAINQQYPGHAQQAGMLAASCRAGGLINRFTIVVDEDIDPSDTSEVLWALAYRCDPATSISTLTNCWTYPIDPILDPEKKERGDYTNSRAIILAVKPFYRRDKFPKTNKVSCALKSSILEKWGWLLES
ncbi:MAG: UbiD family decarboxylase, partial [Candidatus Methanomethylicaceae archaeon]